MARVIRNLTDNKLVAGLPTEDAAYLASICRVIYPPQGSVLTTRSEPTTELWFPHAGVVALTATDASGRSVQTGVICSDGCVGLEALFGRSPALPDAVVQVEGPMSVVQADQFRKVLIARPAIQAALTRFLFLLSARSLQTVACNRLHSLRSRCCRWLLTIQDCVASNDLPLTQENLATLLGSGRPRINGLLATLEKRGLVRRHRGRISLLDRAGLEKLTCDCYWLMRQTLSKVDFAKS
jgi:CRP-like cAMP-binding protein